MPFFAGFFFYLTNASANNNREIKKKTKMYSLIPSNPRLGGEESCNTLPTSIAL